MRGSTRSSSIEVKEERSRIHVGDRQQDARGGQLEGCSVKQEPWVGQPDVGGGTDVTCRRCCLRKRSASASRVTKPAMLTKHHAAMGRENRHWV